MLSPQPLLCVIPSDDTAVSLYFPIDLIPLHKIAHLKGFDGFTLCVS